MATNKLESVEQLKQQGNDCVKAQNYSEAILHYSHAIKLDDKNHLLYSNRSLAFLKLQQYYLAIQDAKQAIKLQPQWPKVWYAQQARHSPTQGFFRKGEVEYEAGDYFSALMSYGQALILDPSNSNVRESVSKTNKQIAKVRKKLNREPWMFCGGGAILGLLIVIADQFLTDKPTIQYAVIQIVLVLIFSGLGFVCLKVYRYLQGEQRRSLLEPPVDLLSEMEGKKHSEEDIGEDSKTKESKIHRKGGQSVGRQRYKKGKT